MLIKKNIANSFVVTLKQNQTATLQDWLFEFTNSTTGEIKYCSQVDISAYPSRYNEFTITDSATEDPYNGTLDFTPTGSWTFKVYEMPVASPPSLTTTGYLAICKEGFLKVTNVSATTIVNFDTDETKSNAVFED